MGMNNMGKININNAFQNNTIKHKGAISMRKMSQSEIREAQLRLLVIFKDFCNRNKIGFFIISGTLLGAVRHGGFIPWDNDIDLAMPRKDYERLKVLLKEENAHQDFRFLCFENNPEYLYHFGKIIDKRTYLQTACKNRKLGLFIDIFPLDSQGNNQELAMKNLKEIHRFVQIRAMCYDFKYKSLSVPRNITKAETLTLLRSFLTEGKQKEEYWVRKIIQKAQLFSDIKNPTYFGCNSNEKFTVVSRAEHYASSVELVFEKVVLPAPVGYKEILKAYYGDYMKWPPENKRHGLDTTKLFWL